MKLITNLAILTIISLPFYLIRCRDFAWCISPIPLTILEVLVALTFVVWLAWIVSLLLKGKETLRRLTSGFVSPLLLPVAFLLLVSTISLFTTSDLRGGFGVWKAYFVEPAIFYIVLLDLANRKKDYNWLLASFLASGLVLSVSSFLDFFNQIASVGLDEATQVRITGLYEFANAIPLFLGSVVALSVSTILTKYNDLKNRPIFYLAVVSLVTSLGAIVLSQSKGGMVGVFAIMLVWLGYLVFRSLKKQQKKLVKYLAIFLIIGYVALNTLVFLNIDNFAPEKRKKSGNSLVNRYCIWQGTRDLLKENLIFGSGLNGYQLDYKDYKTCLRANYQYPHNLFLTFWTEMGILGVLAFVWVAVAYVRMSLKGKDQLLSVGLISALVYLFVHGLVDVPYFKNDLSVQFWLLLALVSVNYLYNTNRPPQL